MSLQVMLIFAKGRKEENMEGTFIVFLAAAAVLGAVWMAGRKKQERKVRRERRNAEFGTNPMQQPGFGRAADSLDEIRIYYQETKEGLSEDAVDEITWNDLEMDRVFFRINHTRSYIGEQVLYRRLHMISMDKDWGEWERQIDFLTKKAEDRNRLEEELEKIGKRREDYYLPMFLMNAESLQVDHMAIYHLLQILFFGSLAAAIVLHNPICLAVFLAAALVNLVVYAVGKVKYEAYLYALGSVKQLVLFCRMMVTEPEWREYFRSDSMEVSLRALHELTYLIGNFQVKKSSVWTGDVMDLVRDYMIGVTLWDITVFGRIVKIILGKQKELLDLYEFAGRIDMEISAASFRESLPYYCIPEQWKQKELCMEGVYHPLLETPVSNCLHLKKGCLITGENASGKSTFIKAAAVNVILAQTLNTCMANRFHMPGMRVFTSMAVRDDLLSGESYYIRELGYLKRIVEAADGVIPVFCAIDEILRGTNTLERLAASEAVLSYLAGKNCIVAAATHDVELVSALQDEYDCYYFKSEIREGEILFDYKIRKGAGGSKNAVFLLGHMGFPKEIVKTAQKLSNESG